YRTHDQVKKYIAEEEALVESRLLRIVCTVIKEQDIDAVELQTSIDAIVSWLVEESHGKNQRVNFEFLSGVLGRIDKISNATEFELVIPMNSLTNAVACALGQLAVELQEKDDDYYIEDVLKRVLEDYPKPMATRLLDQSGQEDILRSMVQRAKTQHVGTHYKYMVIVGGIKILGLRADLIKELDISQAEKEILAVELGGPADLIVQYQEKERKRQEEREIEYLERKQKLEQECEVEFPKEKAKRERAEKEFQKAIETLKQNN
ncbi:hypothetical protein KKF47_01470, partial [Patescibacteria group bacterium]|nr:hypothetical protein [Patescibacteria group bacterium]